MSPVPHLMPVMKARCKTCPFNEHGAKDVEAAVTARLLSCSQHCHGSGHPAINGKDATHLCRGARDYQLQIMYRLGFISAPTDEAWNERWEEIQKGDIIKEI